MFLEDGRRCRASNLPKPSAPDTEILLHFGRAIAFGWKDCHTVRGAIKHVQHGGKDKHCNSIRKLQISEARVDIKKPCLCEVPRKRSWVGFLTQNENGF